MTTASARSPGVQRRLFAAAAIATYLAVTAGAIVCATGSAMGCPDWPGCYGRIVPQARLDSIIEYSHRVLAALALPLLVASAFVGMRGKQRWMSLAPLVTIVLFLAVSVFGALVVLRGLSRPLAAVDISSALLALAVMAAAATAARACDENGVAPGPSLRAGSARLAVLALAAFFVVLVSGVLVASAGSLTRCLGFPLLSAGAITADIGGWPALARKGIAAIAALLIAATVAASWRDRAVLGSLRQGPLALGAVFAASIVVDAILPAIGFPLLLRIAHVALASALWALLAAVAVAAALPTARALPAEAAERPLVPA